MALTITSALAVTFSFTSAGAGLDASITIGGTPYGVTVATGTTYRVGLAPSATDFARVFLAAINTAVAASGRTFALTWGADGRYTLEIDSGVWTDNFGAAVPALALGWTSQNIGVYMSIAQQKPRYVAFAVSTRGGVWNHRQPVALATTVGGTAYGVRSGVVTWEREVQVEWVPRDPTAAMDASSNATPWLPDAANLATLGAHATPWGWQDVLAIAGGVQSSLCLGDFQTMRTSTTLRFHSVAVDPGVIAEGAASLHRDTWERYVRFTLRMRREATTPTATRA